MNLTAVALRNPAACVVLTLLLLTAGSVALMGLPVQLLPPIEEPEITVFTNWRGAAPSEMEAVIVEQQERVLRLSLIHISEPTRPY